MIQNLVVYAFNIINMHKEQDSTVATHSHNHTPKIWCAHTHTHTHTYTHTHTHTHSGTHTVTHTHTHTYTDTHTHTDSHTHTHTHTWNNFNFIHCTELTNVILCDWSRQTRYSIPTVRLRRQDIHRLQEHEQTKHVLKRALSRFHTHTLPIS